MWTPSVKNLNTSHWFLRSAIVYVQRRQEQYLHCSTLHSKCECHFVNPLEYL